MSRCSFLPWRGHRVMDPRVRYQESQSKDESNHQCVKLFLPSIKGTHPRPHRASRTPDSVGPTSFPGPLAATCSSTTKIFQFSTSWFLLLNLKEENMLEYNWTKGKYRFQLPVKRQKVIKHNWAKIRFKFSTSCQEAKIQKEDVSFQHSRGKKSNLF